MSTLNEKAVLEKEESYKNKIFKNDEKLVGTQSRIKQTKSDIKNLKAKMAEVTKISRGKIGKLLLDQKITGKIDQR